ncbi:MAG: glycerol kinase GlpK [Proteobacteria bacterium]|jgi:glycerol kinase|nr:glycerol kinase GlpK [Pseudomonadota bacterium]MDA1301223.1 glycerol kinase GlpK [Pseudomonadota bacterium]
MAHLLAIDQGTTSSRAIIFNEQSEILSMAQQEITQYFPDDGWVEHDPEEIWTSTCTVVEQALAKGNLTASDISAIGITNQRETVIVWERDTGKPVARAIVWQDRRTSGYCQDLREAGYEPAVTARTGLLLDPYFSGTKVKWLLDQLPGGRARAARGDLLFGTVDTFLIWRLTGGESHVTDATNASRTLLFNIHEQCWDSELLDRFGIPREMLPEVKDSSDDFGVTSTFGGTIPIHGVAGDQQAATVGQCCFTRGMLKSTYGTGCFAILNTGSEPLVSRNKLLTTVAYRLNGKVTYGLEGSIFVAGAAVQWLRDGLHVIGNAAETGAIAARNPDPHGVYLVPAFTGLGAPYWDSQARGAILGLTRDTSADDLVTAALQSVCFQTRDLISAMVNDGTEPTVMRVDGGMVVNDFLVQQLSDLVQIPVDRPRLIETTALGAASLAGLRSGVFSSLDDLTAAWQLDRRFEVEMSGADSDHRYDGWTRAVGRVLT